MLAIAPLFLVSLFLLPGCERPQPTAAVTAPAVPNLRAVAAARPARDEAKPGIGAWTQYRGDLLNQGVSYSRRPAYKGVAWKYFTGDAMSATPAVGAGKVIACTESGWVHAVTLDGRKAWVVRCAPPEPGKGIVFSSPMILDGRVYVGGKWGKIHCLDLESGEELFAYDSGSEIYASPKGDRRGIVASNNDGFIFCIDPRTGDEKWRIRADREVGASAAIVGDHVYVPGKDRRIYKIGLASGHVEREIASPGSTHCTPCIGAGYAFLIVGGRKSVALDLFTGDVRWETDATGDNKTPCAYHRGVAFYPLGKFIYAYRATDGEKLWEAEAGHRVTPPIVNGEEVVFAGKDGMLRVHDRTSGQAVAQVELGEEAIAGPVIVDGQVFVAGGKQYLVCIE